MASPSRVVRAIQALLNPAPPVRRRRSSACSKPPASDAFLYSIWLCLRQEFFPERSDLDSYHISWSPRPQKRVLASCNIRRRRVVVARERFEPAACRWIAPVVYHELCHAVLGDTVVTPSGKRAWHGRAFRELESRHPDISALDLWIKSGGWAIAVRSARTRASWARRTGRLREALTAISSDS
jgi:hypothetical protein